MGKILLTALVVLTGMFLLSASIVWAAPAPVAKTGQTLCYSDNGTEIDCAGTGQDGEYQKGVATSPRFTDNGDQTVTDHLTGLMWAKNANLASGTMLWNDAIDYANDLSLGSEGCGISYTDWRLPNSNELQTLIDKSNYKPALPSGHPFSNLQSHAYWSSTTHATDTSDAWGVNVRYGGVNGYGKTNDFYVWPVRSGN